MLKNFISEITNYQLCTGEDKILMAISGGVDSMVMAHLFFEAKYTIAIAHCNFQLRGEESEQDEKWVGDWCDRFKIPFHSRRFETNNYAAENGISIQMAARELRYGWFFELMNENSYTLLSTAHHLNDNLETTLLNLVRGTGLSGLRGMPLKANKIIRPLLGFTKKELMDYANQNNIGWREDVSNESDGYDRNYIRHEVVPKMLKLNPSIESSYKRTHQRLLGAEALFQLGLQNLKEEFTVMENSRLKIDKAFLLVSQYREAIACELLKEYGFNYTQCAEMVQVSMSSSGKKFLSATHQLVIDRNAWIITKYKEKLSPLEIKPGEVEITFGSLEMRIERGYFQALSSDPHVAMLDAEKVRFPLIWRAWEKGDAFSPLGMENRKKISDFFIDNKLSVSDKDDATVVESAGNIVWVVGYRIDNRYKVTDQKKQILRLSVQTHL